MFHFDECTFRALTLLQGRAKLHWYDTPPQSIVIPLQFSLLVWWLSFFFVGGITFASQHKCIIKVRPGPEAMVRQGRWARRSHLGWHFFAVFFFSSHLPIMCTYICHFYIFQMVSNFIFSLDCSPFHFIFRHQVQQVCFWWCGTFSAASSSLSKSLFSVCACVCVCEIISPLRSYRPFHLGPLYASFG